MPTQDVLPPGDPALWERSDADNATADNPAAGCFLMDFIEGRVFHRYDLPHMHPTQRRAVYRIMAELLARLHQID